MPKRPSKHLRPARPLSSPGTPVQKADGGWLTQPMPSRSAVKDYLCPGCNRVIATGTPHVVVWPAVASLGQSRAVDERRHWHTSCWNRRR